MSTTPHPIGTKLFYGRAIWKPIQTLCPVCNGQQSVLVKAPGAPDEAGTIIGCEYCKWALRDGLKAGHVAEKCSFRPSVESFVVEAREIQEGAARKIRYWFNISGGCNSSMRHEDVTPNEEEANRHAEQAAFAANEKAKAEKLKVPNNTHKIGYAKKQIADAEAEIQRWSTFLANQ